MITNWIISANNLIYDHTASFKENGYIDWHRIYAEAAFDRFKIDTFFGKAYLQYAIQGWEWLCQYNPTVDGYRTKTGNLPKNVQTMLSGGINRKYGQSFMRRLWYV